MRGSRRDSAQRIRKRSSISPRGWRCWPPLPETPARVQQELDLQIALGPALSATKGFAAPEVEQTYARARALCDAGWRHAPALYDPVGLMSVLSRAGERCRRRESWGSTSCGWPSVRPTRRPAWMPMMPSDTTLFYLGEYAAAWRHLEQGIALIDPAAQRTLVLRHGLASGVTCLGLAANVLWCLGYPAQAVQRSQEALALARELAHPYSLAAAQYWAVYLHYRRRDAPAVQALAEALLALATAQGFPLYVGFGTCWRGWALALQGQGAAGLEQMRQGLAAIVATGQTLSQQICLVLLAEAAGHIGQVEEGLRLRGRGCHGAGGQRTGRHAGRGVSAPGRIAVTARHPGYSPGRSLFPAGADYCSPPAGQILGAAGGHEPRPALAATGQGRRSLPGASGGLRLVY